PFFCARARSPSELYTLSLHDALPIFHAKDIADLSCRTSDRTTASMRCRAQRSNSLTAVLFRVLHNASHGAHSLNRVVTHRRLAQDRKSTRLNSSHVSISYAVFCLKKK